MDRLTLERRQVWVYLLAIAAGLFAGSAGPGGAEHLDALLWPALVLLLFATFAPVSLLELWRAARERRFLAATVGGNFVVLPLLLALALPLLPPDPALRLGVALVLLAPCTDWMVTFSALGGGDAARATAMIPALLILQLLLLPLYLWWLLGNAFMVPGLTALGPALLVVLLPLGAALLLERGSRTRPAWAAWRGHLAWGPVPLLALVLFLIAGSQAQALWDALSLLPLLLPVFAGFLLVAALVTRLLAVGLRLQPAQTRTLAFGLGTRNSFLVLPFALALPVGWELAAAVIVVQALVELLGMVLYLWWVPRWRLRKF